MKEKEYNYKVILFFKVINTGINVSEKKWVWGIIKYCHVVEGLAGGAKSRKELR